MKLFSKNLINSKNIILFLSLSILTYNLFFLSAGIILQLKRNNLRSLEPGLQYSDFKEGLAGVRRAGFVTNKDLSPEKNDGEFLQAQYILAPTVLELNASKNKYNILDCTSKTHILYALKSLNAAPVQINKYGKILAIKQ